MTLWRSLTVNDLAGKLTLFFLLFCVQAKISVFNSYLNVVVFFVRYTQFKKIRYNLNLQQEIQMIN